MRKILFRSPGSKLWQDINYIWTIKNGRVPRVQLSKKLKHSLVKDFVKNKLSAAKLQS